MAFNKCRNYKNHILLLVSVSLSSLLFDVRLASYYTEYTKNELVDAPHKGHPTVELTDKVLKDWTSPIVIPEYKLVFFPIPKVASTEWKILFKKLMGLPEVDRSKPNWGLMESVHNPNSNNLTYLTDFDIEQAQVIMTSDEWTRATVVREPKERILSAFLNKFVQGDTFQRYCCKYRNKTEECRERKLAKDFTYFLHRTRDCSNEHWEPQYNAIDSKWWPYITSIGYMDNITEYSKELLQSVKSEKTGLSAWEQYGSTGWGSNGTKAFMEHEKTGHATNAGERLSKFYTKEDEEFVEKHWAIEWESGVYEFEPTYIQAQ